MAHAKGGSTTQVDQVGPKSDELINLENQFYSVANPIMEAYTSGNLGALPYDNNTLMGRLFNDATQKTNTANARYDELGGLISNNLNQAQTAGDWWYDQAADTYGKANNLVDTGNSALTYSRDANKWYDTYAQDQLGKASQLLETGEIPQALLDRLTATVNTGLDQSMGSTLADLAARGVLNSSVTNKGVADMSRSAADALNAGYLDAFNSVLGGYHTGANTAANTGKSLVDTYLNINHDAQNAVQNAIALGDSYGKTGSMRVGDLLNVANTGMAERDQLNDHLGQYYMNAASPMMPAFELLQQMQTDHWNSNKKDTVVKQGK